MDKQGDGEKHAWNHRRHLRAWIKDLDSALRRRGTKVELARWLADGDTGQVARWQVSISKILAGEIVPGGDVTEAIRFWLQERSKEK